MSRFQWKVLVQMPGEERVFRAQFVDADDANTWANAIVHRAVMQNRSVKVWLKRKAKVVKRVEVTDGVEIIYRPGRKPTDQFGAEVPT